MTQNITTTANKVEPTAKPANPNSRRRLLKRLAAGAAVAAAASTAGIMSEQQKAQAAGTLNTDTTNASTGSTVLQGPGGLNVSGSTTIPLKPVLTVINQSTGGVGDGIAARVSTDTIAVYGESLGGGKGVFGLWAGINQFGQAQGGAAVKGQALTGGTSQRAGGWGGAFYSGNDLGRSAGAALFLQGGGTVSSAPTGGAHAPGEFAVSSNGKLWYCAQGGNPGVWGQIAPKVFLPAPQRIVGAPVTGETVIPASANPAAPTLKYIQIEGSFVPNAASSICGTIVCYNAPGFGYLSVYPADVQNPQPVTTMTYAGGGAYVSSSFEAKLGIIPGTNKLGIAIAASSNVSISLDITSYTL